MDEKTLDVVARAAGILRNRIGPDVAVAIVELSEESAREIERAGEGETVEATPIRSLGVIGHLHDFAADVQEVVAFARGVVRAESLSGPAAFDAMSVTTDDVTMLAEEFGAIDPDAFSPANFRSASDDVEFRFRPCGPDSRFSGVGEFATITDDETE